MTSTAAMGALGGYVYICFLIPLPFGVNIHQHSENLIKTIMMNLCQMNLPFKRNHTLSQKCSRNGCIILLETQFEVIGFFLKVIS